MIWVVVFQIGRSRRKNPEKKLRNSLENLDRGHCFEASGLYEFGAFRLNATEGQLLRGGSPAPLSPKTFHLLVLFVENQGRLLTKDELLHRIWPDTFVEESSLNFQIATLRKALGDKPGDPQFIETLPKRGYRFIAPVRNWNGSSDHSAPEEPEGMRAPSRSRWLGTTGAILVATFATGLVYSFRRQPAPQSASAEAYELLLRGKAQFDRDYKAMITGEAHPMAVSSDLFAKAIQMDDRLADAHAWLSLALYMRFANGFASQSALEDAIGSARHALQLDPQSVTASRALIYLFHATGQTEDGLRQARLIMNTATRDPIALEAAAMAYFRAGMLDRATACSSKLFAKIHFIRRFVRNWRGPTTMRDNLRKASKS
jgi:DNA-binding winged helix-turn-helix (wHTH) protein